MNKGSHTVIDLFSGCGGLSYGFIEAGYKVILGIDNWIDAILTFEHNHKDSKGLIADMSVESPEKIAERTGIDKADIIIGGPPCQGFSIAGKRIIDDERNKLYKAFVAFVAFYKPKSFLMENVPNIISIGNGIIKDTIISDFERLGYNVSYKVLLASDFGVPQNRKRAIFVGLRNGKKYNFPEPNFSKVYTTADAISDLPENTLKDGSKYTCKPKTEYQEIMRNNSLGIYNHTITEHSQQTIKIISLVPDGGNYKDLPLEYQNTRNVHIAWTRLRSKKPSFTTLAA